MVAVAATWVASLGRIVPLSVPNVIVVVVLGWSRGRGFCGHAGASESLALVGDVLVAAQVLIDDALAQRPAASFAVGVNGS
ncbi:MAG: hypothetical protein ACLP8S_05075 [Solirubrobacteraceae bacterium]